MATVPTNVNLSNSTVDILNVVRNNASATYQERVPIATQENIKDIGQSILYYESTQNEFLNSLVNRIGMVLVTSKMYQNPLREFKRGVLELGESIEEIFVNIAKGQPFDPEKAETELFKREIPDIKSAFHHLNVKNFYKTTVTQQELNNSFLTLEGVTDLISKIIESLTSGATTDEYLHMKNLIERYGTDGKFYPVKIDEPTDEATAKKALTKIKSYINKLTFVKSDYNYMGVLTHTTKEDMILLIDTDFDALIDVEALAYAFNMNKADVDTRKVVIDDFGILNTETNKVIAILVDKDWFMVYDRLLQMSEEYNAQGLYWNYFYHVWKLFSTSPFANAVIFETVMPTVTSVAITPTTKSIAKGATFQFISSIITTNNGNDDVYYVIEGANSANTKIDTNGLLSVASDETATTITVTVSSVFDNTKTASATVTVTA